MAIPILGLDIGGANLKAAHTDGTARTVPFALWQNPGGLSAAIAQLRESMPHFRRLAVTMTGELCDCFATKREGVRMILESLDPSVDVAPVLIWSTQGSFLNKQAALANPFRVAAANWLALANYVGRQFKNENVLLIDTGSTTTDIVYIERGVPKPHGLTDPGRLASGELVYTGVRRTPICSVLGTQVAAEFFATMQDAYLVLGMLAENPDDCSTADARPLTRAHSHARLARMKCADVEMFSAEEAHDLAELCVESQWNAVHLTMERVVADRMPVERLVVSGSGEILGRRVWARSPRWSRLPLTSLTDMLGPALSEAACAYAVALLARDEVEYEPWWLRMGYLSS
jgi:hypothetical protein